MLYNKSYSPFVLAILGRQVTKLYIRKVFQDLLPASPLFTINLFNTVAEMAACGTLGSVHCRNVVSNQIRRRCEGNNV
jgi:hypothetical protein